MSVIKEAAVENLEQNFATDLISLRKTAFVAGVLYVIPFVSIPTLSLYSSVHDPNYIVGFGPDTSALIGALLELIVAFACIGTAITLFPILMRQNEGVAVGFVASRILEASAIFVGIACILSIVSLRQAGVEENALVAGQVLITVYDRTFLLGQGVMPAVNALLLGSLLYQSRLVPRTLPLLGIIGAPLLLAAHAAVVFGFIDRVSPLAGIAALPIALWELSLGIWLVFKGFNPIALVNLLDYRKFPLERNA